jgi:hypothetical protein
MPSEPTASKPRPILCTIVCIAPGCRENSSWLDEAPSSDPDTGHHRAVNRDIPAGWRLAPDAVEGAHMEQFKGFCIKHHGGAGS